MEELDLSECDREPIQFLERTQNFAALAEFSHSGNILSYSQNWGEFFGIDNAKIEGSSAISFLGSDGWELICSVANGLSSFNHVERLFHVAGVLNNELVDMSISNSSEGIIVEIEKSQAGLEPDFMPKIRQISSQLEPGLGLEVLAQEGADYVRALTGFERVMIYKFHPDQSGEVIAESLAEGVESFLGLRFPATDIPKQARELYQRNLVRIISDVDELASKVSYCPERETKGPLDLSMAISRAVSPIHIQYLKNMGVKSSMSISIAGLDGFWGLIACHNISTTLLISHPKRSATELFGQIFSFKIGEARALQQRELAQRAQLIYSKITSAFADIGSIDKNFVNVGRFIQDVIDCDGIVARIDGKFHRYGQAPDELSAEAILDFLRDRSTTDVFFTDNIAKHIRGPIDHRHAIAGILCIPISRLPDDYLILCRGEIAKTVKWAGDPNKAVRNVEGNPRLLPRESFAEWVEAKRGFSKEWATHEIELAEALKATFVEVLFKLADKNARERARANKKQELLINELNHRVRNIITLISNLVEQSSEGQTNVEGFRDVLEGRIASLARAHDLMTNPSSSTNSLCGILETELKPYAGAAGANRLSFKGSDIVIAADAIPVMSLVLHELVTNAVKYGSLSIPQGRIEVTVTAEGEGGVLIAWREVGGPPVQGAGSAGTGTALIEEAIPYQLSGSVQMDLKSSGMQVLIRLPQRAIDPSSAEFQSGTRGANAAASMGGRFLVVEDEYVIATTVKKLLKALGAHSVEMAPDCRRAIDLINSNDFDFAVLDINLGKETSEIVANELLEQGVPFVFASGYGDAKILSEPFQAHPRVTKPYSRADLLAVLPGRLLRS